MNHAHSSVKLNKLFNFQEILIKMFPKKAHFEFILSVLILLVNNLATAMNVSFDGRAFLINGERTMIMSGSVHYPRASPSEWPGIIRLAKESGINMIETYVFWDIHEPVPGEFYFPSDGSSSDLIAFLSECQRQSVYVNVRFGPYVCAEWNYGIVVIFYNKSEITFD